MTDSGAHPSNTGKLKFSLVAVKLFLAFAGMWVFSLLCYVIFVNKLNHIYASQRQQAQVIEKAKININLAEGGIKNVISFLREPVYTGNLQVAKWEQVRGEEIAKPLDTLRVLIAAWNQPESRLIYTALRLNVHKFNKLVTEACILSESAAHLLTGKPNTEGSFLSGKKLLDQKITDEIQPQATEINQQIHDLRTLLETQAILQQQVIASETNSFHTVAIYLFIVGVLAAFFFARIVEKALSAQQNGIGQYIGGTFQNQGYTRQYEAKVSAVLNTTDIGILAIDTQYKITVINKSLKDKYANKGINLNIGSDYSLLFTTCNYDWEEPCRKAFSGESFTELEHDVDSDVYIEACYNPIKDEHNKVIGVTVFIQDVSEHKHKEMQIKNLLEESDLYSQKMLAQESILLDTLKQIQESQKILQRKEADLSAVINNTDNKIIAIDTEYKITVINAALKWQCIRNGIHLDVGSDYRLLFKNMDEKEWMPYHERAFAGEKFVIKQMQNVIETGTMEVAFNPIRDANGAVTGVCIYVHDITERVKIAEEKQILYQAAQENAEELQAQQEELRQNLEELMSTQEELEKIQKTLLLKEARLRALINNTADAIFSIDTNYTIDVINDTMEELFLSKFTRMKEGDNFLVFLPEDKKQTWLNFFNRSLAGEYYTAEWENLLSREFTYHELSFNPVRTEDGTIVGVSVFIRDISDRKKQEIERASLLQEAEERQEELMSQQEMMRDSLQELMLTRDELERQEAQLSSQINAINKSNNILELDLNGNILEANDSFLNLVGYSREELLKNNYQLLIPEEERNLEHNRELWRNLMTGKFYSGEFKRITKDGNLIWTKATYNPVLNAQGKPYKIIKFAYDITARVQDAFEKKKLYEKISRDAEELRMQEEELRQNLEELKVTQEALVQQKEHIQEKEARLRALIDNTEDDIFAIDTKYTITVLNKAVQARYAKQGLTLELGYNIFSIIPKTNTAYWKVNFDKALGGEKFSIVDQVITKDGEVYFDVSFNPIRNDKDQVIGVSILSRNINQYKMAEKENLQTIDILRKIQDKVASMNSDKEKEIEDYKKKVERLRKEMNGNLMN